MKTDFLKTMVKVNVYLLGQSSHVSAIANLKGTHTECFEKVEEGKLIKLLDSITELISNNDIGGGRVVRRCWVNFQCRGVLQFGLQ